MKHLMYVLLVLLLCGCCHKSMKQNEEVYEGDTTTIQRLIDTKLNKILNVKLNDIHIVRTYDDGEAIDVETEPKSVVPKKPNIRREEIHIGSLELRDSSNLEQSDSVSMTNKVDKVKKIVTSIEEGPKVGLISHRFIKVAIMLIILVFIGIWSYMKVRS